jgi:oligopeptide transport system permease protein
LKRNRFALLALVFLALVGVTSLLAPLWPLPSPAALHLSGEPMAPKPPWVEFGNHGFEREYWRLSGLDERLVDLRVALFGDWQTGHWLGTDAKGRDLLSRIVWGSRTSIAVALLAMATSLVIGVVWGAFSGFVGGRVDRVMMRIVDVLYSLPFIFIVIFLITVLQGWKDVLETRLGIDREVVFYLTIGAVYWLTMARVVRGQVLSLRHADFVEAARQMGASTGRILFVHVVPNVLGIVIVYLTLSIPAVMLFESFLTFLGLGIEAPKVSWGLLAVDGAETITPLGIDWWLLVWPALAMGATLLALNVLGDGMRDALDPKLAGGRDGVR